MSAAWIGQTASDEAENMALTLWMLRRELTSDDDAAKLVDASTAAGLDLVQEGTPSQPAASSSLADWIVPALVGCLMGLGLYLTWRVA